MGALRGIPSPGRPVSGGFRNAEAVCAALSAAAIVVPDGGAGLDPVRRCARRELLSRGVGWEAVPAGGAGVARALLSGEGVAGKRERNALWRGGVLAGEGAGEGSRGAGTGTGAGAGTPVVGDEDGRGEGLALDPGDTLLPLLMPLLPCAVLLESLPLLLSWLFCRRCCSSCSNSERRMASITISCNTMRDAAHKARN